MSQTQVDLFCAPDETVFAETVAELRAHQLVLLEAETSAGGNVTPFVMASEGNGLAVLFGRPLDAELGEEALQHLAQSLVDYHREQLASPLTGANA